MADEPVSARRDRLGQKLARAAPPPLADLAAAAAVVVLAVASTAAARSSTARERERAALTRAELNLDRANANFRLAQQAVDDYLTRVSENTLLKVQPSRDLPGAPQGAARGRPEILPGIHRAARRRPGPPARVWPGRTSGSRRSPTRSARSPQPSPHARRRLEIRRRLGEGQTRGTSPSRSNGPRRSLRWEVRTGASARSRVPPILRGRPRGPRADRGRSSRRPLGPVPACPSLPAHLEHRTKSRNTSRPPGR